MQPFIILAFLYSFFILRSNRVQHKRESADKQAFAVGARHGQARDATQWFKDRAGKSYIPGQRRWL